MKPKEKPRKTGSSLVDALGLGKKKKSEVTPGQTATSNRETGAEVISILRSIDFAHGRLQSMADEEQLSHYEPSPRRSGQGSDGRAHHF